MAHKNLLYVRRQAIVELSGTNDFDCTDTEIVRWGGNDSNKPTEAEIAIKLDELQGEYDAQAYARNRASEYPSTGDQLDYIYHNGVAKWKTDMIDPVKTKYPKG